MKHITLDVSDEFFEALSELSGITEPDTEGDRIARLLTSSIRTYEWLLYQQYQGRKLVVLDPSDLEFLQGKLHELREYGKKPDSVSTLFPEDRKPQLEEYFHKAA